MIGGEGPEFTFRARAGIDVGEVSSCEDTFTSGKDLVGGVAPPGFEPAPASNVAEAQKRAFAVADLALASRINHHFVAEQARSLSYAG